MKIVHRLKETKEYTFEDLNIGDCFLDEQGDLSIKTREDEYIYATDDNQLWSVCTIVSKGMIVRLLDATLVIEGDYI